MFNTKSLHDKRSISLSDMVKALLHISLTNCKVAMNVLYLKVPRNIRNSMVLQFVILTATYRPNPLDLAFLYVSSVLSAIPYLLAHLLMLSSVRHENLSNSFQ